MTRELLEIRSAGLEDAPAIARLAHDCFSTYRSFMGPGWDPPTVEWSTADAERRLAGVAVRSRVVLAGGAAECTDRPASAAAEWRDRAPSAATECTDRAPSAAAEWRDRAPSAAAFCAWMPANTRTTPREPITGLAHLWMLFVEPPRWGTGLATELLEWAASGMAAAQYSAARLWTPTGQARARAFYERHRWRSTGHEQFSTELALPVLEYRVELV